LVSSLKKLAYSIKTKRWGEAEKGRQSSAKSILPRKKEDSAKGKERGV